MKINLRAILFSLFICVNTISAQQRTCGTDENMQNMISAHPELKQRHENLEKQIGNMHEIIARRTQTVVVIPVVVHVIHNGENVGVGTNISDAQVQSQIAALNKDFRLLNPDSLQPSHAFWPYTWDAQIEFCLAKQTPGGQPTTGIERIYGGPDWTMSDCNLYLKPQTYWDPSRYLNLWTVDWDAGSSSLLGYAQFPGGPDSTDGVVIRYDVFGTTGNVTAPFNKGRTATHEIGHWLNLFHIWGDATCGDDLISDTPTQEHENLHCPSFPRNAFSICGSDGNGEMYMNYMDYVDDACMVMFTYEQTIRMNSTLFGSRSFLITSNGCAVPNPGIDENEIFAANIDLFPNPSGGQLSVQIRDFSAGKLRLTITDISGRIVKIMTIESPDPNIELDLSELSNGVYLIHFNQKGREAIKKLSLIK